MTTIKTKSRNRTTANLIEFEMAFSTLLILSSSLIAASYAVTDAELTQKYRFNKVLDGSNNYKLYWSFSRQEETITFAVRVGTTGWIGFGLSPNGQMPNSDVVVGWVDNSGTAQFHVSKYNTIAATCMLLNAGTNVYRIAEPRVAAILQSTKFRTGNYSTGWNQMATQCWSLLETGQLVTPITETSR